VDRWGLPQTLLNLRCFTFKKRYSRERQGSGKGRDKKRKETRREGKRRGGGIKEKRPGVLLFYD